jgi:hypothetical protein
LKDIFLEREERLAFSEFAGTSAEERVATFVPLLHLDSQHRVWLEQEGHFDEIWILLKEMYEKQNSGKLEEMKREAASAMKELSPEEQKRADEVESQFENPLEESVEEEGDEE